MSEDEANVIPVEFTREEYERLMAITDSPAEMIRESAMRTIELEEAIDFTQDGGFHGPDGFAKIMDETYPNWPLGSLLGINLLSMEGGESRWELEAGPPHANPMGTIHGGYCAISATQPSAPPT